MNPASKTNSQTTTEAPFLCDKCGLPATVIGTLINGPLLIIYHNEPTCKKIMHIQMISLPQQVQPRLVVPQ